MTRITPGNSFTLPPPNLGTYRWVDVYEEFYDCNSPSPNYIEQLQIVDEKITWKELDRDQIMIIAKASLAESRRKRLAIK